MFSRNKKLEKEKRKLRIENERLRREKAEEKEKYQDRILELSVDLTKTKNNYENCLYKVMKAINLITEFKKKDIKNECEIKEILDDVQNTLISQ